jgi:hypothetical protein
MQTSLGRKPLASSKTNRPFLTEDIRQGRVAVVLTASLALATMAGAMIAALHLFPV